MKHLTIILAIAILTGCATLAAQPAAKTEPPKIVQSDAFLFSPVPVEKAKAVDGSFLDESGKYRWVPVRVNVLSPSGVMMFPQAKPESDK